MYIISVILNTNILFFSHSPVATLLSYISLSSKIYNLQKYRIPFSLTQHCMIHQLGLINVQRWFIKLTQYALHCFSLIPLYFYKIGFVSWLLQSVFYQLCIVENVCKEHCVTCQFWEEFLTNAFLLLKSKWMLGKWQLYLISSGQHGKTEHRILSSSNEILPD